MSRILLPFIENMVRIPWRQRLWSLIDVQGPVVRTAPNEVSFSSPEAALELFKTGKGFHKTDFYGVFPPPENPDIFTETRESVHAVKKRYAATPYSLASMQQSTDRIEATERVLTSKLDDFAGNNRVCDLGQWLHFYAFDVRISLVVPKLSRVMAESINRF